MRLILLGQFRYYNVEPDPIEPNRDVLERTGHSRGVLDTTDQKMTTDEKMEMQLKSIFDNNISITAHD